MKIRQVEEFTTKRRGRTVIAIAVAVVAFGLVGAAPAQAAESVAKAPAIACWLNADDSSYQCFDSSAEFEAAVVAQTGLPLLHAGDAAPASRSGGVQPAATYLLGTMYADQGWSGSTLSITTGNSDLCATHSYTGNSMPAGWANVVSSFKSYGTCKTRLSSNVNQGGTTTAPQVNVAWLGIMNDDTESYRVAS